MARSSVGSRISSSLLHGLRNKLPLIFPSQAHCSRPFSGCFSTKLRFPCVSHPSYQRRCLYLVTFAESSSNGLDLAAGNAQYDFDLFTIYAGSGGVRASRFAAVNHGASVAVCELPLLDYILR